MISIRQLEAQAQRLSTHIDNRMREIVIDYWKLGGILIELDHRTKHGNWKVKLKSLGVSHQKWMDAKHIREHFKSMKDIDRKWTLEEVRKILPVLQEQNKPKASPNSAETKSPHKEPADEVEPQVQRDDAPQDEPERVAVPSVARMTNDTGNRKFTKEQEDAAVELIALCRGVDEAHELLDSIGGQR